MQTLKKDKDFEKVARKGRPFFVSELGFKILENSFEVNRYGIVVSTKLDKRAVVRNKLHRRVKNIIKKEEQNIKQGFDLIFLFRESSKYLKYSEVEEKVIFLFKKAQIFKK
jgi:ribonuclease P protein component